MECGRLSVQFFCFSRDLREAVSDSEDSDRSFIADTDTSSGGEEPTSASGTPLLRVWGSSAAKPLRLFLHRAKAPMPAV